MLTKTEAIVLRSFKYGESRLIADMYTRDFGRLSFAMKLPKTRHGQFRKQLFQPMTLLTIETDVRPRLQLQSLAAATLLTPLPTLQSQPVKLSVCLFLAEFLYHALKGEQKNQPLFDYIKHSICWLDGSTGSVSNFHLVFLMHTARFLGFHPNLDHYVPGCYFDLRAACFCSSPPLHRDTLMPDEAEKLQLMMRMDYPTMHLYRMTHADRSRLLTVALDYYRLHLPAFPSLRSLEVMQEVWGE